MGYSTGCYDIHFFYDETPVVGHYEKGVIATEYGSCLVTTDFGETWQYSFPFDDPACPTAGGNVELWSLAFSDPLESSSEWWVVGGKGTNQGYVFTSDDVGDSWVQTKTYDFLDPDEAHDTCGPATFYGIERMGSSTPWYLTAGYGQFALRLVASGAATNYDPCGCLDDPPTDVINPPQSASDVWVQIDADGDGIAPMGAKPQFFVVERMDDTFACLGGSFGRIAIFDGGNDSFTDVATKYFNRLYDAVFMDANDGFLVGQGYALWSTDNGGVDCSLVSVPWTLSLASNATGIAKSTSGEYFVIVGTGGFVARGTNYGANWSQLTSGASQIPSGLGDLTTVTFVPGSSTAYAVGSAGTVIRSDDNGATWDFVDEIPEGGEDFEGVSFISTDVGYVVGEDAMIYQTTNGGFGWNQIGATGSSGETFFDVAAWPDGSGVGAVVVGQNGVVFVRGASDTYFTKITGLQVRDDLLDVEQLSNGQYLRICSEWGDMMFRDSGSWSYPKSHARKRLHKMAFLTQDEGFAVGGDFVILKYE